ncbi:MAG: hypothetical protein AVDCRST_MAG93-10093 [uncultured Chloroflexia bacterium]|uniref:Uncharacterized protein n=1 Tax=uncultured Chloroflexia bacterium TaxID=1672391 RepID=A0A6J4NUW6_9CHLR|nr:MAG: hypothetical protein AVDCRST_MAG93-10093 [uncultured Chloroflexia bacterium]
MSTYTYSIRRSYGYCSGFGGRVEGSASDATRTFIWNLAQTTSSNPRPDTG